MKLQDMNHSELHARLYSRLLMIDQEAEQFKIRAGIIKSEKDLKYTKCTLLNKDQLELL